MRGISDKEKMEKTSKFFEDNKHLFEDDQFGKVEHKFDPNTDQHLEHVLKLAYRYALGDLGIGSNEMVDTLCDALCNLIGDDAFCEWVEKIRT